MTEADKVIKALTGEPVATITYKTEMNVNPELTKEQLDGLSNDPVNHPAHYTFGKYEVIDVIEDWQLNYHLGNAVKYIARSGRKGDAIEDLQKAVWYINRVIEKVKEINK